MSFLRIKNNLSIYWWKINHIVEIELCKKFNWKLYKKLHILFWVVFLWLIIFKTIYWFKRIHFFRHEFKNLKKNLVINCIQLWETFEGLKKNNWFHEIYAFDFTNQHATIETWLVWHLHLSDRNSRGGLRTIELVQLLTCPSVTLSMICFRLEHAAIDWIWLAVPQQYTDRKLHPPGPIVALICRWIIHYPFALLPKRNCPHATSITRKYLHRFELI